MKDVEEVSSEDAQFLQIFELKTTKAGVDFHPACFMQCFKVQKLKVHSFNNSKWWT